MIKNLPANAGDVRDMGPVLGLGRSPGGGHGNPLQYSCPENPMDRGAWRATVHRLTKSQTQLKQLSMHACISKASLQALRPGRRTAVGASGGISSLAEKRAYGAKPLSPCSITSVALAFWRPHSCHTPTGLRKPTLRQRFPSNRP